MSETTTSQESKAGGFGAATEAFGKMWTDFAGKMAAAGMAGGPQQWGPEMARQMRDTFLGAWADACEKYMRTEEFRKMMRDSMQAAIELRKQLNEQLGDWQHTMQGASRQDMDRLLQGLDGLERRFNETYEQLVEHVNMVSGRLDAIEKRTPDGRAKGGRAQKKPAGGRKAGGTKKRGRRGR